MKHFLVLRWFKLKYAPPKKALLWDEWKYQKHHWDEDLMIKGTSHQMQKMIKDVLIDVFVSCFVDVGVIVLSIGSKLG